MNWFSTNWPTVVGWLITVLISVSGWIIEAHVRKKGQDVTNKQVDALTKQAKSLESLSRSSAHKDDSDPWGQPELESGSTFRIINQSQRTVTVTNIDVFGNLDTSLPYDCGPGDSIRYVFYNVMGAKYTVHVEWHFKDEPDSTRTSVRQTPEIS